jgi:hypothetical protein
MQICVRDLFAIKLSSFKCYDTISYYDTTLTLSLLIVVSYLFWEHSTTQTLTNTHIHSPLWMHTRTPYPYEYLRRTESADLEVDEVTIGASQLTDMSHITKRIAPDNPRIIQVNANAHTKSRTWIWVSWFHHKEPTIRANFHLPTWYAWYCLWYLHYV